MHPDKEICSILMPIYIVSKILGLAPFNLRHQTFTPHYGLLDIVRFCLLVGGLSYAIVLISKLTFHLDISEIALRCELYLGTCMTTATLVLALIKQKSLIEVVEKLIHIDEHLKQVEITPDYKYCKMIAILQMIAITCIFIIKLVLQVFNDIEVLLIYSVFNVVNYMNVVVLLQFVNMVLLVRQRFIWVNKKLEHLAKSNALIYLNTKEVLFKPIIIGVYERNKIETLIVNLGKIYSKLCCECRLINNTFNIQILLTITCRFIMLTAQLINVYDTIKSPYDDGLETVLASIYLVLHCTTIFIVATVSENTKIQAKTTGFHLHNLWDFTPELRNEIEYFSLQILHQNLSFTAYGFFTLDHTLVYSIVGAVATYLIIVIQFERA